MIRMVDFLKTILIVEDEEIMRRELNIFLTNNGFAVEELTDFENALEDILQRKCDLILLDIKLPDTDGAYLCKALRNRISTPIIMVTSKDTELDEILCINYGADDFITKPYNPQVLLARINRLLDRLDKAGDADYLLQYQNAVLDVSKSMFCMGGQEIDLSKNECKIFYYLLKNRGRIISRDELMDFLWDNNQFIDDNTLTVNINRLRKKLEEFGFKDAVTTKRGQGYIIF